MTILTSFCQTLNPDHDMTHFMYQGFKDLTDAQFERGVKAFCLAHDKFYPGDNIVAIIRKYALTGDEKTAGEAWEEVRDAMQKNFSPYYHNGKPISPPPPSWSSPLIKKAVDCLGGLRSLGNSTNDVADRARFVEFYRELLEKAKFKTLMGEAV